MATGPETRSYGILDNLWWLLGYSTTPAAVDNTGAAPPAGEIAKTTLEKGKETLQADQKNAENKVITASAAPPENASKIEEQAKENFEYLLKDRFPEAPPPQIHFEKGRLPQSTADRLKCFQKAAAPGNRKKPTSMQHIKNEMDRLEKQRKNDLEELGVEEPRKTFKGGQCMANGSELNDKIKRRLKALEGSAN